ncbi:MAG: phosphoribosylformylglycinamidine cyclo-ligase [Planctomycetota bacterium]
MTTKPTGESVTYKTAGVDIDAKYAAVQGAAADIKSTHTAAVLGNLGGFGSLFRLHSAGKYHDPVLVASTDGVGTKLAVAVLANRHDTVGQCIVNHCVNDILVMGARPLFFLDYIAVGKMEPRVVHSILSGMTKACRENGCALVGGETAEMPGLYKSGDYDLAGFIVGIVEKDKIQDGSTVRPGDICIGLPSTGLHTNGYSLARKIFFDLLKLQIDDRPPELGGATISDSLLAVHRSYLNAMTPLLEQNLVRAMCHITGGGFQDNIPRVLPAGTSVVIDRNTWTPPPLFRFLVEKGRVPADDAFRTLNMGIGMVVIVRQGDISKVLSILCDLGEAPVEIGRVIESDRAEGDRSVRLN